MTHAIKTPLRGGFISHRAWTRFAGKENCTTNNSPSCPQPAAVAVEQCGHRDRGNTNCLRSVMVQHCTGYMFWGDQEPPRLGLPDKR